jgi:hypothetical protein
MPIDPEGHADHFEIRMFTGFYGLAALIFDELQLAASDDDTACGSLRGTPSPARGIATRRGSSSEGVAFAFGTARTSAVVDRVSATLAPLAIAPSSKPTPADLIAYVTRTEAADVLAVTAITVAAAFEVAAASSVAALAVVIAAVATPAPAPTAAMQRAFAAAEPTSTCADSSNARSKSSPAG